MCIFLKTWILWFFEKFAKFPFFPQNPGFQKNAKIGSPPEKKTHFLEKTVYLCEKSSWMVVRLAIRSNQMYFLWSYIECNISEQKKQEPVPFCPRMGRFSAFFAIFLKNWKSQHGFSCCNASYNLYYGNQCVLLYLNKKYRESWHFLKLGNDLFSWKKISKITIFKKKTFFRSFAQSSYMVSQNYIKVKNIKSRIKILQNKPYSTSVTHVEVSKNKKLFGHIFTRKIQNPDKIGGLL